VTTPPPIYLTYNYYAIKTSRTAKIQRIQHLENDRANQKASTSNVVFPRYLDLDEIVRNRQQPTKLFLENARTKFDQWWQAMHAKFSDYNYTPFPSAPQVPPESASQNPESGNGEGEASGSGVESKAESQVPPKPANQSPESGNGDEKASGSGVQGEAAKSQVPPTVSSIIERANSLTSLIDDLKAHSPDFLTYAKHLQMYDILQHHEKGKAHIHVQVSENQTQDWIEGIKACIEQGRAW
jgi:hypothetical protein